MGNTNISLSTELKQEAQSKGFNISKVADRALREALNQRIDTDNEVACYKCSKAMRKATVKDENGLYWDDLAQAWICPNCDKAKIAFVPVRQR